MVYTCEVKLLFDVVYCTRTSIATIWLSARSPAEILQAAGDRPNQKRCSNVAGNSREQMAHFMQDMLKSERWSHCLVTFPIMLLTVMIASLNHWSEITIWPKTKSWPRKQEKERVIWKRKSKLETLSKVVLFQWKEQMSPTEWKLHERLAGYSPTQINGEDCCRLWLTSYQEVWLFSQHNNSSKGSCNSVWSWRCATSRLEICTSESKPGGVREPNRFLQSRWYFKAIIL